MSFARALAAWTLLASALGGCSDDAARRPEPTSPPRLEVWEDGCESSEDCDEGLCTAYERQTMCAPGCTPGDMPECPPGTQGVCVENPDDEWVCQPTCEDGVCPEGLQCVALDVGPWCVPPSWGFPPAPPGPEPEPDVPEPEPGIVPPLVEGTLARWHLVTLDFVGPEATEAPVPEAPEPLNPFLDVRLDVTFRHESSGVEQVVPGFYAGDGRGGSDGSVWRVRWRPDEQGLYRYEARMVRGPGVAVGEGAGEPVPTADGATDTLSIGASGAKAPDFRALGPLRREGHYLWTGTGALWLKAGLNSPENWLGYAGFDNTAWLGGGRSKAGLEGGLHTFAPHVADWQPGDPDWGEGAGRGIIGALNYLAGEGINSVYMLTCNLEGDGDDVSPYLDPSDPTRFDVSKLDQWETVFLHAQRLGIALHLVLHEEETEAFHDAGTLGVERRLYYRELVARFSHHAGLVWNIGEQNGYPAALKGTFVQHLRELEPFEARPFAVHTTSPKSRVADLVGSPLYDLISLGQPAASLVTSIRGLREDSAAAVHPWVVSADEQPSPGLTDSNAAELRRTTLWPAYLSGAGGVEWFMGYHPLPLGGDLRVEDFRTRAEMWPWMRIAREFALALPLESMAPASELLTVEGGSPGVVMARTEGPYAVYLPDNGLATLDLSATAPTDAFTLRWYDPITGDKGDLLGFHGGGPVALGAPPFSGDVAALIVASEGGIPLSTTVTGAALLDAQSGETTVTVVPDPLVIDLADTPLVNLVVHSGQEVAAVVFDIGPAAAVSIEEVPPFAIGGSTQDDFYGWTPDVGSYALRATGYDQWPGGEPGQPWEGQLVVVDTRAPSPQGPTFAASGGLVVIEAESLPAVDGWSAQSGLAGASGSYLVFQPGSLSPPFEKPGEAGFIRTHLTFDQAGLWQVHLRSSAPSSAQDTLYLAFPTTGMWINGGDKPAGPEWRALTQDGADNAWTWDTVTTGGSEVFTRIPAPGTYAVQLSGRAAGFKLDRLVLRHESVPVSAAEDLAAPQSATP